MFDTTERFDAFIFYFDLIGVVEQFLADGDETLRRLQGFQREARAFPFTFRAHSTIKTLADNVWARVNADDHTADVRVLELAAHTMRAARNAGFDRYFGVVTKGEHAFDIADRTLTSSADPTDISVQHIDMTSEPHIRAAFAEKWSGHLAKAQMSPISGSSVWISEEVFPEGTIEDSLFGIEKTYKILPVAFDLKALGGPGGKQWPFNHSKFRAIALK